MAATPDVAADGRGAGARYSESSIAAMPTGSTGRSRPSVGDALERVDDVHPVGDLAEDRVLAVEPRARVRR